MIECSNAEIRDQLPDLVNGLLAGDSLLSLRAHVAGCSSCQAEVQLIERSRAILIFATPRIDASRIAQRIPAPRGRARSWGMDWRIAASIAVLAVGGGGTALMYNARGPLQPSDSAALIANVAAAENELPLSADLSGLSDDQLRVLVGSVQQIEALPTAEPSSPPGSIVPDTSGAW
jgi:anti-sigma factor RsiW